MRIYRYRHYRRYRHGIGRFRADGVYVVAIYLCAMSLLHAADTRPSKALAVTDPVAVDNQVQQSNASIATAIPLLAPKTLELNDLQIYRSQAGKSRLQFALPQPDLKIDVRQQHRQLILQVLNAQWSAALVKKYQTPSLQHDFQALRIYNHAGNAVLVIQTARPVAYQVAREQDVFILHVEHGHALKTAQHIASKKPQQQNISLDFQDIELRRVLQLLAQFSAVNMVLSDSVQGRISLNLKEVAWEHALETILKTKNLAKRQIGQTLWIAPTTELIQAEENEAKAIQQNTQLDVLQTRYRQLNYAKASDIEKLIRQQASRTTERNRQQGVATEDQRSHAQQQNRFATGLNLMSERGSLSVDQRTNTLIIHDSAYHVQKILQLVDLLDVPIRQVMVEARIVRANTDFSQEMGVKWGILATGNDLIVAGSEAALQNLTREKSGENTQQSNHLNVDLGVTAAGRSQIAFGLINLSDFLLDLELSALQADGHGEVISTPKVMTADKQKAKVASGQQVPYQTQQQYNNTSQHSTSYKDALLSLDVTPSITPDGKVQMQLHITSDSPAGLAPNGEIILNKNEIDTNVLVRSGETVVLGGIFEQERLNRKTKVPILGDLPALGRLFRKDESADKKSELLIFVTPRIVNDSSLINH
ncbi:type IV pilus secretin PilQ [Acinetobacter larvae]|uniref:Secretin/TonB short N-terminal domain-containing protein n=1 Tax=Acinetobacter larvae TaxID=1789224 RepID=A0A1B2M2L2_9GAMM|nr:type IV pilus secretin PilQ [Acinetobacter larvae]AOA59440.1 hypothetical protein BFG52_14510 [Acinetobacter larvae]